ncbi:hypothetical protein J3B02_000570 [Coemansia erecta]|nr:hypothetical protein J3B02_000570 [Coemansia erecta]KAJ2879494.1 hypothetical protein FB639_003075 [Coemansia asiatica]
MYIPASSSSFLQTARGSPMSCSASTSDAESCAASYIGHSYNSNSRHPSLSLRMQSSSGAKRPSSYFPQYDRRQSQQMQKPVYAPPAVVRKDSGEIVRPCLRKRSATTTDIPSLYQQQQQQQKHASTEYAVLSSSGPANGTVMRTPRFVHFGADLECVRWFLKAQSPRSVCEDATPDYCSMSDDDSSYAVAQSKQQQQQHQQKQQKQPSTVRLTAIRRPNPAFSIYEESPVVLERVELADNKRSSATLRGTVKVHNLAFEKSVMVRYSFDQWRTVNEASASYNRTLLESQGGRPGIDRFAFTLTLPASVTVCLPSTIAMCVHYSVNSSDFWDNNSGANYMFKLALPAAPAIADDDADMDAVQTMRSRQTAMSDGSSELYAPRRLTFGRSSQRQVGQIPSSSSSSSGLRNSVSALDFSSAQAVASSTSASSSSSLSPSTAFAAPTSADSRRYMAQSAALFGSGSLSASAADAFDVDSSSDSSSNNGSDNLATQAADDCPSPSAYMQQALCTLQPELPLYQDVAWRGGGDLASSYISSPPAAAASTMYVPFAYAPTTYYGGSGSNRMYSASYSAVSPPSEYLSSRPAALSVSSSAPASSSALSSAFANSSANGSTTSNGSHTSSSNGSSSGAAGVVPFSASRTGSPLATPMRTASPIRHSVFDSDGAVRTGSPLAWSRNTTASALFC